MKTHDENAPTSNLFFSNKSFKTHFLMIQKEQNSWAWVQARLTVSRASVWKALTQPEYTVRYMYDCELHAHFTPGGEAVWRSKNEAGIWEDHVRAEVLKYDPMKCLTFKIFHRETSQHKAAFSELHFILEKRRKELILQIKQGDFSKIEDGIQRQQECQKGWEYILPDLIKTCESIEKIP